MGWDRTYTTTPLSSHNSPRVKPSAVSPRTEEAEPRISESEKGCPKTSAVNRMSRVAER